MFELHCYRGTFRADRFQDLYEMADAWECSFEIVNLRTQMVEFFRNY